MILTPLAGALIVCQYPLRSWNSYELYYKAAGVWVSIPLKELE